MDTDRTVEGLKQERARLDRAIAVLDGLASPKVVARERAGNRSATRRTARNEARRHDAGGQKRPSQAMKTPSGAQKEGILRAARLSK